MKTEIRYTPRELSLIRLLLLGQFRKSISTSLKLSQGYIDNLIQRLYLKLDCHSMEELLIFLFTNGFAVNAERTVVTYLGKEI